ncbi:hypothetical protein [Nocardia niwae]|uniref:hypothetical protein n=1 Tax=Nocardia niwae TaxID=626084 RepID=UPI0007A3FA66|nr:hypothetical protein [Nocardia niwae]
MTTPVSLSIANGTVMFTDRHGRVYTAADVVIEDGDVVGVEIISALGEYATVTRDGEEVGRYPLRDAAGWHLTDMEGITVPRNPFLPPVLQMPVDGGATARTLWSLWYPVDETEKP